MNHRPALVWTSSPKRRVNVGSARFTTGSRLQSPAGQPENARQTRSHVHSAPPRARIGPVKRLRFGGNSVCTGASSNSRTSPMYGHWISQSTGKAAEPHRTQATLFFLLDQVKRARSSTGGIHCCSLPSVSHRSERAGGLHRPDRRLCGLQGAVECCSSRDRLRKPARPSRRGPTRRSRLSMSSGTR